MKPPSGCQRQNQKLRLIAEKGGKSRIALFSAVFIQRKNRGQVMRHRTPLLLPGQVKLRLNNL